MEEQNYLQSLFDKAKEEVSEPTFEQVSQRFEASVAGIGLFSSLKEWLLHHPYLKYISIMSTISIISITIYFIFSSNPTTEKVSNYPTVIPQNEKEITLIEKDSLQLISKENITPSLKSSNENAANEFEILPIPGDTSSIEEDFELEPFSNLPELRKNDGWDLLRSSKGPFISPSFSEYLQSRDTSKPKEIQEEWPSGWGSKITTDPNKWGSWDKRFSQTYGIAPNGTTQLTNEFGKIGVKTWNKDSVKIDVIVTLDANDKEKAQNILKEISVAFNKSGAKVSAKTVIEKKKFINWYKRKNWSVDIDYQVFVPIQHNIEVKNYNGDIVIGDLKGKAKLELRFGDIEAVHIGNGSHVNLHNGDGNIKSGGNLSSELKFAKLFTGPVGTVDLKLNNSTFEAEKAKNVTGSSSWGKLKFGIIEDYKVKGNGNKIEISQARDIKIEDNNAKIKIDKARKFEANLRFSDIEFKTLEEAILDIHNSHFKAEEVTNASGSTEWGSFTVGSLKDYDFNSKGTEVNLGTVNTIKSKGHSTKMKIEQLNESLDLDFQFGFCKANLTTATPKIALIGNNAAFTFSIPQQSKFNLDFASNTKNFNLPKEIQFTHQIERIGEYVFKGSLGTPTTNNEIKAQLKFGELSIEKGK